MKAKSKSVFKSKKAYNKHICAENMRVGGVGPVGPK